MKFILGEETFDLAFPTGAWYDIAEKFGDGTLASIFTSEELNKREGMFFIAQTGLKWAAKRDKAEQPKAAKLEEIADAVDLASVEQLAILKTLGQTPDEEEVKEDLPDKEGSPN